MCASRSMCGGHRITFQSQCLLCRPPQVPCAGFQALLPAEPPPWPCLVLLFETRFLCRASCPETTIPAVSIYQVLGHDVTFNSDLFYHWCVYVVYVVCMCYAEKAYAHMSKCVEVKVHFECPRWHQFVS